MTLGQIAALIWAGRWRVLLCVLACLGGAMAITSRLPKSYEAKARVILELMQPDPVVGTSYNVKTTEPYVRTQQLLVGSNRVAEGVIDKLGWAQNPEVIAQWQTQTGGRGDIRSWAAERLLGQVAAYPLEGAGTLEIVYRAPEPAAAEAIVRAIRESYIETSLALQTEAAARRAKNFEDLLVSRRVALQAAQSELVRAQRETGTVLGPMGQDLQAGMVRQLQDRAMSADIAAQREQDNAALYAGISRIQGLRRQLISLETQIALAGNKLGDENPQYQAMLTRRNFLIQQMSQAQALARADAARTVAAAREMAQRPEADYQAERDRVLGRSAENLRIQQARRLVELRLGEVNRLEANRANAVMLSQRTESGLVVMGDVITNPTPVAPDVPLNALLAGFFGLGLGLASVMIDGLWKREVLTGTDLARAAGVPVLAVLSGRKPSWLARLRARLVRRGRGPVAA